MDKWIRKHTKAPKSYNQEADELLAAVKSQPEVFMTATLIRRLKMLLKKRMDLRVSVEILKNKNCGLSSTTSMFSKISSTIWIAYLDSKYAC